VASNLGVQLGVDTLLVQDVATATLPSELLIPTATAPTSATVSGSHRFISDTNGLNRVRYSPTSEDGRWVVFESDASFLISGIRAEESPRALVVRDRVAGENHLITRNGDPVTPFLYSDVREPFVSRSGEVVLFLLAGAEVAGFDLPPTTESLFAFEPATGALELLSGDDGAPTQQTGFVSNYASSADGRWIAVETRRVEVLIGGVTDPNGATDVVLIDRSTGIRTLVSRSASDPRTAADRASILLGMSPDGSKVLLGSDARNLVSGFVNSNGIAQDVYVYDRVTGQIALVSGPSASEGGDARSIGISVSDDGLVVFQSQSSNLFPGFVDLNGGSVDFFKWRNGAITLAVSDWADPNVGAEDFALFSDGRLHASPDGRRGLLETSALNIIENYDRPSAGTFQFYWIDFLTDERRLLTREWPTSTDGINRSSFFFGFDSDGERALFSTTGGRDILPPSVDIPTGFRSTIVYESGTDTLRLVSHRAGDPNTLGSFSNDARWVITPDASTVVFSAASAAFLDRDFNDASDVLALDIGRPVLGGLLCDGQPNSTGVGADLSATGSRTASRNDLTLRVTSLPPQTFTLFLGSSGTGVITGLGGGVGDLCIAGSSIGRYSNAILGSGPTGEVELALDLTQTPLATGLVSITAGMRFGWQCWYRDTAGGLPTSNLSSAVSLTFH
ncbi:MAG: hypothetical protein AAFR54_00285, partial [Planctomycetota bacterium]